MWAQLSENMHLSFLTPLCRETQRTHSIQRHREQHSIQICTFLFSRRTYHARVTFLYHVARGLLDFGVRYFTVTWFLVSPRTCYLLDTKTGMYSVKRDLLQCQKRPTRHVCNAATVGAFASLHTPSHSNLSFSPPLSISVVQVCTITISLSLSKVQCRSGIGHKFMK